MLQLRPSKVTAWDSETSNVVLDLNVKWAKKLAAGSWRKKISSVSLCSSTEVSQILRKVKISRDCLLSLCGWGYTVDLLVSSPPFWHLLSSPSRLCACPVMPMLSNAAAKRQPSLSKYIYIYWTQWTLNVHVLADIHGRCCQKQSFRKAMIHNPALSMFLQDISVHWESS